MTARRGPAPEMTREQALTAPRIDLHGIAAISGIGLETVKRWRGNYLKARDVADATGQPIVLDRSCLLAPDEEVARGGLWAPWRVVAWLKEFHRMDDTLTRSHATALPGKYGPRRKPTIRRGPRSQLPQTWTREEALAAARVDLQGIAVIAGVGLGIVKKWRRNYLQARNHAEDTGQPIILGRGCLLAPDEELAYARGGLWDPQRVVAWLKEQQQTV